MKFQLTHGKTLTATRGERMVKVSHGTGKLLAYSGVSLDDATKIAQLAFAAKKAGKLNFTYAS